MSSSGRLRDRQRRQGIYSTGAQPLPRLTRAQSKAYEGLPVIAISSLFSAGGFLDSQFKGSFIGTSLASMLNKCIVRLGVLHVTSRRVDGFALRVVAPSETTSVAPRLADNVGTAVGEPSVPDAHYRTGDAYSINCVRRISS